MIMQCPQTSEAYAVSIHFLHKSVSLVQLISAGLAIIVSVVGWEMTDVEQPHSQVCQLAAYSPKQWRCEAGERSSLSHVESLAGSENYTNKDR